MARLAVWIGNVRDPHNANNGRNAGKAFCNVNSNVNQIENARLYYVGDSGTNNDTLVATTIALVQATLAQGRVGASANQKMYWDEEQVLNSIEDPTAWLIALAGVGTRADVTDATKGGYRWFHGKHIYAMGYVYSTASGTTTSMNAVTDIANVNWK